ncbi:MAG: HEAT repeat domain-containing protein [Tannerella sp.]|jgi:hypothetical protein|nr:HEAT repeat domain-containing protein [Tannerella sp.]
MKLQPLYDLQQEINRLFIAGSKFTKGDLRLQKQIPVFRKLGEKAPVFAKLATDVEELIQTDTHQSAEKLMALSTLLYSILYTQGELLETEVDAREQQPLIALDDVNTGFSYLQLRPVIEALSTSNQGRLEVLKDAKERGLFSDSRTYQYLDVALADKYGELADYVEKTIIPSVGKPMLPFLQRSFQYLDKTEHVRRLRLLEILDSAEIPRMIEHILAGSLPSLQAETVIILAKDPSNEELIIKLAGDKNKLVREAAYKALAKLGTKNAIERLKDLYIQSKDKIQQLPAIVAALATSELPYFFKDIFTQVKDAFEEFIALDKKTDDKILVAKLEKFGILLDVLQKKDEPEVDDFFVRILTDKQFAELVNAKKTLLEKPVQHTMYAINRSLANRSPEKAIIFYDRYMSQAIEVTWLSILWYVYFKLACKINWPKDKLYERFHIAYLKGYLAISDLYNIFTDGGHYYHYQNYEPEVSADLIDPRWLKDFYSIFPAKKNWTTDNMSALVMLNACDDSKKCNKLLEETLSYVQPGIQIGIIRMLIKRNIKDKFDIIYSAVEKFPANNNYMLGYLKDHNIWSQFPEKYAPKFRKLAEKKKNEVYNEIADEIANK